MNILDLADFEYEPCLFCVDRHVYNLRKIIDFVSKSVCEKVKNVKESFTILARKCNFESINCHIEWII